MGAAMAQGEANNIVADTITAKALDIVGDDGKLRASVNVSPQGTAGIWFYGPQEDVRGFLGSGSDGTPNLFLYDPGSEGSVRAALETRMAPAQASSSSAAWNPRLIALPPFTVVGYIVALGCGMVARGSVGARHAVPARQLP